MRFLHTSDWHIGRQLHGRSLLEDQAHVLDQIVAYAEFEEVDAVIIAGDVYDRAVPPAEAVRLLDDTLNRLCRDLGKTVVVIAGNHDSGDRLGFGAPLMGDAGLHIVGPVAEEIAPLTLHGPEGPVDIFALPYATPVAVRHVLGEDVSTHEEAMAALLKRVDAARTAQRPTVVVSHCFVDGATECESERPLSIGGADRIPANLFSSYHYTALGHLHGAQYQGAQHIRYSGSILKYSFSETRHNKSVTLVDLDADGGVISRQLPLEALRDVRIVEGSLADILEQGQIDPRSDDFILARLTNSESLLDVMGKLRVVYPNVLQMQHIGARERTQAPQAAKEMLGQSHLALFEGFFTAVHDDPLSDAQRAYFLSVLESLAQEGVA